MRALVILGIWSLFIPFSTLATAHAGDAGRSGLFGDIRLGGGIVSVRPSGLEVLDDNERRDNLASRGSRQSEGLVLLGAELGYTFKETGTTLLAGIGTESPFTVSLRHEVGGVGELTLCALYEKKEVWRNPYLVGVNRSRTDAESVGFALNWERILGTGARLVFEQMNVEIEDDLIGQLESDLRRDGRDTTLGLGYSWDLGTGGVLSPSLSHTWIDREGDSNRGCEYVAELKHLLGVGSLIFATRLELKQTDFDRAHPIFHKKREETAYGISEFISFAEPFGFKDWSLFGFVAIGATDSNISFFDNSILLSGTGLGYKF